MHPIYTHKRHRLDLKLMFHSHHTPHITSFETSNSLLSHRITYFWNKEIGTYLTQKSEWLQAIEHRVLGTVPDTWIGVNANYSNLITIIQGVFKMVFLDFTQSLGINKTSHYERNSSLYISKPNPYSHLWFIIYSRMDYIMVEHLRWDTFPLKSVF